MARSSRSTPHDRRRFLKLVALATLSSTVGSSMKAYAQKPVAAKAPPAAPDTAAAKPPEIGEDARALAAIIKRRFGTHLTDEQLEAVTRQLDGAVQSGKALRGVKLANGDEPDVTFKA